MTDKSSTATAGGFKRAFQKDPYITRLIIMLIVVFVFFSITKNTNFLKPAVFQSMGVQFPEFGIMAVGVMLCMITGGIDLSVVSIANLSGVICATYLVNVTTDLPEGASISGPVFVVFLLGVVIGMGCGLFNGFLVSKIKIPPILATLGTFELFKGIAIVLSEGKPISGLPGAYSEGISTNMVFGAIPVPLLMFVVVVIVIGILLSKTTFGTKIYMLGTNQKAAKYAGLKTTQLYLKAYMLSGMLAAVSGLIMMANYNSAKADYGSSYQLQTVLVAVLGGVNPNGGQGKVAGLILSVVVLQILSTGINMFPEINSFYRFLIWGGVLLVIMILDYSNPSGRRRKKSSKNVVNAA